MTQSIVSKDHNPVQLYVLDSNGYPVPVDGATTADGSNAGLVVNEESSIISLSDSGSKKLTVTTSSTPMAAAVGATTAVVTVKDVDVFMTQGASPTAVSDGTDQILLAGNMYRVTGITSTNKLAFITASGTATVYITAGG